MMLALNTTSSKLIDCCRENLLDLFPSRACPKAGSRLKLGHAMPDATIHSIGTILENLNPILYRVSLPNGKKILAHLSKPLTTSNAVFQVDQSVIVELTAYDFDNARILGLAG